MSKRESISRLSLIIKKLKRNPSTYEEISDYLSRESELQAYDFNVSKRTFQRDLEDIRSLFNIEIKYDFSRKVYMIENDEQIEVTDRILAAFDTFNALNITDRLSKYIHFEKRKPQGTDNLYGLLHAIKNKFTIHFLYQKFWDEEAGKRTVEPYALKEFKNRWYIIAKDLNDERVKTFGLDRLTNLDITRKTFKYLVDYDVEEEFKYCYGIISPNGKEPEEIILSFNQRHGKYIKSLPLHETQEIILDTEDELQIKLKLCNTFDFRMELLSYGDNVKVLKPVSLIIDLYETLQKAVEQYK